MRVKLILVDDQPVYEELFRDIVSGHYELTAVVDNYDDALTAVERLGPDAAVVDVNIEAGIGGRDGFRLARALLRLHPGLRIILVSAYADGTYAALAEGLPRTTFVAKMDLTLDKLKDILGA